MDEYTKRLLRLAISGHPIAMDTVWDAVGPNGIGGWWDDGRSQETYHLALALMIKDPDIRRFRVGEVITRIADAYLGENAETVLRVLMKDNAVLPQEIVRLRNSAIGHI
jgi:hypothetical protein